LLHERIEGGSIMAFSPTDPVSAHSLWLQLLSSKRKYRRLRWHSDSIPVWFPMLLFTILALVYVMMQSNDVIEQDEHTAQKERVLEAHPMLGAMTAP
jgi:hypothetical protein